MRLFLCGYGFQLYALSFSKIWSKAIGNNFLIFENDSHFGIYFFETREIIVLENVENIQYHKILSEKKKIFDEQ